MDALEAPAGHPPELEARLSAVEARLAALGNALRARDSVEHRSARRRAAPRARQCREPVLRRRAATARCRPRCATVSRAPSGQVAAQRESLARATAALDRAIDVLLPRDGLPLYSSLGAPTAACSRAA